MHTAQIVYVDVLILTNFIINASLLLCTGKLSSQKTHPIRIAISSALGSIYCGCMFFPSLSTGILMILKLIFAVTIVSAAFGVQSLITLIKNTTAFLSVSFLFGGCAFALYYFTPLGMNPGFFQKNSIFYIHVSLPKLLFFSAISYIVIYYALSIFKRRTESIDDIIDLELTLGDKSCRVRALCDTGNMLTSPVKKDPVIICERDTLSKLTGNKDITLWDIHTDTDIKGVIFLPFSTLGKSKGIIPAFPIDKVSFIKNNETHNIDNILLAVNEEDFLSDKSIDAVINPRIFNKSRQLR